MIRQSRSRFTGSSLPVAVIVSLVASIASPAMRAANGANHGGTALPVYLIGITTPYRAVTLSAVEPGRIAQIETDEGRTVQKGDPVFRMVDDVQRARTMMAKATAETSLRVELARAVWEREKEELARLTTLRGSSNASSKELSDARSAERIAKIEYEVAKFDRSQALLAYDREKAALDQRRVLAPFTGYVVECLKRAGETVTEGEGVIRIVQLDPLLVTINWPLSAGEPVQTGDQLLVRPYDERWSPRTGTVTVSSRVADSASQTYKVKLTVPNVDGHWMSGLKVAVEYLPEISLAGTQTSHAP